MSHLETELRVGDTKINVRKGGQGRPILFLHGAGGVMEWTPFFDKLSKVGELWVPDHPGFGQSDDPAHVKSMSDLAMFYLDFLDTAASQDGFDVVGHSLGAWLAAEIAVRNSTHVRSITFVSAAGLRVRGVPIGDPFIWNEEEAARNFFFDPVYQERRLSAQLSEEQAAQAIRNKFSFARLAWSPRLFNPDLEKWLHRIKVPTQVVWGRDDKLFPSSYAAAWGEKLKTSNVTVIPQCGHHVPVEKSDELTALIAAFLEHEQA